MSEERCGNCRFFERYNDVAGMCRRHPPTFLGREDAEVPGHVLFSQPEVHEILWCGEWRKIREE